MTNNFDDAASQDVIIHAPPSLVISPNLDALLEHDERMRRSPLDNGPLSSLSFQSPHSSTFSSAFPVGLPPPPRSNRKTVSRPSTPKESDSAASRSSRRINTTEGSPGSSDSSAHGPSGSNPYINTPPKLPQLDGSVDFSTAPELPDPLGRALVDSPTLAADPDNNVINPSRWHPYPVAAVQEDISSSRPADANNFPLRTYPTLPRVEKLIGRGKSMFSMSSSQSHSSSPTDRNEEPEFLGKSRARDRGALPRFPDSSQLSSSAFIYALSEVSRY